jgi:hypothetical protein
MRVVVLPQIAIVEANDFYNIILANDMSRTLAYAPLTAHAALLAEPETRTELQVRFVLGRARWRGCVGLDY